MSLFQFGFRSLTQSTSQNQDSPNREIVSTLPTLIESGLGRIEYEQVTTALSDDSVPVKKRRGRPIQLTPQNSVQELENMHLRTVIREPLSISCRNFQT